MGRLAGRERHSRENEKGHTLKAYYVCLEVKKNFVKRLECVPSGQIWEAVMAGKKNRTRTGGTGEGCECRSATVVSTELGRLVKTHNVPG